ncbi:MAG: hypothetical protein RDV48_16130 [Candidatus Eremiobacteraeota bacterium]|nr:hypothetical protein [Candidatus Eremiobacteraeota bacterium]
MMNKAEAIEKLRGEGHSVTPHEPFEVDSFRPEDAWGIARIFYAVYGDQYPVDTYYIPGKLIEENENKSVLSAVARTSSGAIVGHGAIYRSSAPCEGTCEIGQFIVHPLYRRSLAMLKIQNYLLDRIAPAHELCTLFGEAVCHHLITQKLSILAGYHETAIEVGLLPAATYQCKDFPEDRISTLLTFRELRKKRQIIHIPEEYREALAFVFDGMDLDRDFREGDPSMPSAETELTTQFFDDAHVARVRVSAAGRSFEKSVGNFEALAARKGIRVMQFCLNLADSASGYAVKVLRSRGYFLGGFLPRWFDTDGLLLQKVLDLPAYDSIRLASDKARRILELIKKDAAENPACGEVAGKW